MENKTMIEILAETTDTPIEILEDILEREDYLQEEITLVLEAMKIFGQQCFEAGYGAGYSDNGLSGDDYLKGLEEKK